jgi:hypothetical protein
MSATQQPSDEAFFAALAGEDDLGVVVRAHIYVEAMLLELLSLLVVDSRALERMELDYAQRVTLAVALGLKAEYRRPLLALGTLRNAFAHRLDTTLSEGRIKDLYDTLEAGDKERVQIAYERTKRQLESDKPSFSKLAPKERFALIAVTMRGMLLAAVKRARDGASGG